MMRSWNYYTVTKTKANLSRDMTKPTKCAQRWLRSAWASAQSDQSSLSAWKKLGSLATHWAHSEDSDQTGRMPRLIWVFAGRIHILLVLSCCGSFVYAHYNVSQAQMSRSDRQSAGKLDNYIAHAMTDVTFLFQCFPHSNNVWKRNEGTPRTSNNIFQKPTIILLNKNEHHEKDYIQFIW